MLQKTYSSHHHHPSSRPSTAASCASVSPSTSLRTINGKAPLRSALRSRTSNSTLTNGGEPPSSSSSGPEMLAARQQQPPPPPLPTSASGASLRQAYFDKYPRPRATSPSSSARERVEAYRHGVPPMSFPAIDDDPDDEEGGRTTTTNSSADEREPPSSSSSSSPRPPRGQRPTPKKKVYTHRSTPSTEYNLNSPTSSSQISTVPMPASRPTRSPTLPPEIRTSLSSSYTQTSLSTPKSSIHRSDGVLVAVPAPTAGVGVETMDALVQGMNGGEDHLESITKMFGRRAAAQHKKHFGVVPGSVNHPLYQPPVPPLPAPRMTREDSGTTMASSTYTEDEGRGSSTTAEEVDERRKGKRRHTKKKSRDHTHQPQVSREQLPVSREQLPVSRERKPSDVRQPPALSIDEIIRKNMPQQVSPVVVPSINDIIRSHAPPRISPRPSPVQQNRPLPGHQQTRPAPVIAQQGRPLPGAQSRPSTTQQTFPPSAFGRRIEDVEEEEEEATGRSSIDSITAEVRNTLRKASANSSFNAPPPARVSEEGRRSVSSYQASSRKVNVTRNLHHAKSFGDKPRSNTPSSEPFPAHLQHHESEHGHGGGKRPALPPLYPPRPHTSASASGGTPSSPISVGTTIGTVAGSGSGDPTKLELAQFLRSPRLTRLMTLRRPPHSGLTVSLADVGSPTGHPVIVYLGLGCVRYLIALYDEMAEALNLRLVCVDRWGLGRTGEPQTSQGRGLLEWAAVIEEVADTLGLRTYSVVAHSAGAPYALAGVLKCGERRVQGSVHLLAPWVSMSVDTGYKWLKYVPNGIIKTAQAAEWKVQGWRLGKPPTISYPAVGYDATAPLSSQQHLPQDEPERPSSPQQAVRSSLSIEDYDDLADFDGQFGSTSTLGQTNGANNGKRKKPAKAILSIFPGKPGSVGRTSRANSIVSTSGARTLPAKSPKLKGLKSLSSLRHEPTAGSMLSLDSWAPARGASEPPTPSFDTPPTPDVSLPPVPTHPSLGLGLDEEMMQWGARLKMLEEISPPTPPSSVANGSNRGGAQPSRSSGDGRSRRSISLTGGRPDFLKDIPPPVPQLAAGSRAPRKTPMSLTNALLRASHAESLKGGTADLLAILERDSKPWGFSYADVKQPVKVWYGDKDEKIAVSSVHWMERVMKDCTVNIVKGGTHNLMTNTDVVVEVLESIAREAAAVEMTNSPSSASVYRRKFRT